MTSPGTTRLFLLHGADIAGSDALAARLAAGLGPNVERVVFSPSTLKADPALLADEAAAFSLFGDRRLIVVDGGGDELVEAVAGLLAASQGGNAVVVVTGALKKTSKLLALVEGSPIALANASYLPEGRDGERLVVDLGAAAGLTVANDLARRIAASTGGDRRLTALEIDKYALYLDAAPDRRATLDAATLDALSADADEGDTTAIVDAVLDGDVRGLDQALSRFGPTGAEPIVTLRAASRRLLLLIRCRGDVDEGKLIDAVMASSGRSVFFKERPAFTRQLGRWSSAQLATASTRMLAAERELKTAGSLGAAAVGETLFAVAHAATRRR